MPKQTARVGSEVGLHARPAAVIARKAQEYEESVYITFAGETIEATSGLMIMTLGAQCGDEVIISSESAEAVSAVSALVEQALQPL